MEGGCPEVWLSSTNVERVENGGYELGKRVENLGLLEVGEVFGRWRGWEERRRGASGMGFGGTECGGWKRDGGCFNGRTRCWNREGTGPSMVRLEGWATVHTRRRREDLW